MNAPILETLTSEDSGIAIRYGRNAFTMLTTPQKLTESTRSISAVSRSEKWTKRWMMPATFNNPSI